KVRHDCVTCGAFTAFSDGYDSGGYFRLEEKLKENFLKNDSRKIVASDFSTMVDFLHDFTRFKRRLDDFWSIFKSKSWIEMNS
uniref:Uncharacterized protein n=1 Tax=Romanomermis culicivorax TaxID=13658 RepID=A0A915HI25_ROMCU